MALNGIISANLNKVGKSKLIARQITPCFKKVLAGCFSRWSTGQPCDDHHNSYKLLVVGGGTGGTATAHIFSRKLGKDQVAVIEPSDKHYYQPLWTLVGGGIRTLDQSIRPMGSTLPSKVHWIKDSVVTFDPDNCTVTTSEGKQIKYEYLVVAMGLQLNYHLIKGLPEAFNMDQMLCSNYSPKTVVKTRPAMEAFKEGNAIFTFPNAPIKCAGAPQKILYLTEEYFRKSGKRDKANMIYNTALPRVFGIPKYATALQDICTDRNIQVNTRHNLIEVKPDKKEAIFEHLDTNETITFPYEMLHISPPCSSPDVLSQSPLVNKASFVTVQRETLQHTVYPNVFAIGDCTDLPVSKTAAAIASQSGVLKANLSAVMDGKPTGSKKYDGYAACPLVTASNKCIMAEFDWDGNPMETFPFNQAKERRTMYYMKQDILPLIYWQMLVKGFWFGPKVVRKIFVAVELGHFKSFAGLAHMLFLRYHHVWVKTFSESWVDRISYIIMESKPLGWYFN